MKRIRRLTAVWAALTLTACAASLGPPQPYPLVTDGWTPVVVQLRSVGLSLPGGAVLAAGVTFAGGLRNESDPAARELFFREADGYRRDLLGRAYFIASAATGHYYFNDDQPLSETPR